MAECVEPITIMEIGPTGTQYAWTFYEKLHTAINLCGTYEEAERVAKEKGVWCPSLFIALNGDAA